MLPLAKNIFLLLVKDSMCNLVGEPFSLSYHYQRFMIALYMPRVVMEPWALTPHSGKTETAERGAREAAGLLVAPLSHPPSLGDAPVQRCSNRYVPGIEASLCSRKVLLCLQVREVRRWGRRHAGHQLCVGRVPCPSLSLDPEQQPACLSSGS